MCVCVGGVGCSPCMIEMVPRSNTPDSLDELVSKPLQKPDEVQGGGPPWTRALFVAEVRILAVVVTSFPSTAVGGSTSRTICTQATKAEKQRQNTVRSDKRLPP